VPANAGQRCIHAVVSELPHKFESNTQLLIASHNAYSTLLCCTRSHVLLAPCKIACVLSTLVCVLYTVRAYAHPFTRLQLESNLASDVDYSLLGKGDITLRVTILPQDVSLWAADNAH
jgi:hypothetical protein